MDIVYIKSFLCNQKQFKEFNRKMNWRNSDAKNGSCRKRMMPSSHVKMIIFVGIFFLS